MGCHSLLQGIFPTQGSNPGLLHGRQILYHLSYREVPIPRSLFSARTFQNGSTGQCHDQGQHHGQGQKLDPSSAPTLPRELLGRVWGVTEPQHRVAGRLGETAVPEQWGKRLDPCGSYFISLFPLNLSQIKIQLEKCFPFPWEEARCPLPQGNRLNDREMGVWSGGSEGGRPQSGGLCILKAWKTHGLPRKP